jgi:hypothetical protein
VSLLFREDCDYQNLFNDMDVTEIEKSWYTFGYKILCKLWEVEREFRELCIEYGVRDPLPTEVDHPSLEVKMISEWK